MPVEHPHLALVPPCPSGTGKQKLELHRSGSEHGFLESTNKKIGGSAREEVRER